MARGKLQRAGDGDRLMAVAGRFDRGAGAVEQHVVEVRVEARFGDEDMGHGVRPPARDRRVRRRSRGHSPTARPANGGCWSAGSCRGCRARRGSARRFRSRAAASPPSAGLPEREVGGARQRARRRRVQRDDDARALAPRSSASPSGAGPSARPLRRARSANRSRLCIRTSVGAVGIERAVDQRQLLLAARLVAEDLGLPFGAAAAR